MQTFPHPSLDSAPARPSLLPLGALAAGFGLAMSPVMAQTTAPAAPTAASAPASAASGVTTLSEIKVKAVSEPAAKQSYQATTTRIGKGQQELRDVPQSVTVVTEKLLMDRNLDDLKEVLRTTAGVTFQSGETGEEDVRLRGFSLATVGDLYVDGLRDAPLYERDTFNHERIEVLKGSASMLFGRGSTGGVVNQVSKQPFLMSQNELNMTVGSGEEVRLTGDFNFKTGDDSAFRLNVMNHTADKWGAKVDKQGIAPTFAWGIGTADEFSLGLFHLEYDNVPAYNHPWFLINGEINPSLRAKNFYGLNSDYNRGSATYGTAVHTHRFGDGGELRTTLRNGHYTRDLWASVIRFGTTNGQTTTINNLGPTTIVTRTPKGRVGVSDITNLQSDYTNKVKLGGMVHNLTTGLDFAHEDAKRNNNFAGPASGLNTTVGTPNNGDTRADPRGPVPLNEFTAKGLGIYVQDLVELTPTFKLLGGLRFDRFDADYETTAGVKLSRNDSMFSPRFGVLFQPSASASYHVSYGQSFNTSGDTYQLATTNQDTPPEKSRNFEIGAKYNLFNNRLSVGASAFYAEKYNERNRDPDVGIDVLSGKRHAAGIDLDLAGQITKAWDAYLSFTWMPSASIDKSVTASQVGARSGLSPKVAASAWTTYRVTPQLRLGGGANHRGEQTPEGSTALAKSFTTYDLMAEYALNDTLTLKANLNNVTDELYADSLYRGFYSPGAPRTFQLTLTAKY